VPFCAHKCDYCDFYSLSKASDYIHAYITALAIEAAQYKELHFDTLYIGGGTPSFLGCDNLARLISVIKSALGIGRFLEATVEINPDSTTLPLLHTALQSGINRVSIGVQSLSDYELRKVSRIHTSAQALTAIDMAVDAGFKRISADVIVGLPGQTQKSLLHTLEKLVAGSIDHISVYCLTLEHETPLSINPPDDLPMDDAQADFFLAACDFLQNVGFVHYEISNFARTGYECVHNLNYWRGGEYVGLGPAAASHLNGKRYRNKADLFAYVETPCGVVEDIEQLEGENKMYEEVVVRLRLLQEGVDIREMSSKYGTLNTICLVDRLNILVTEGMIIRDGSLYKLSPSAVLISNSVLCRLLPD